MEPDICPVVGGGVGAGFKPAALTNGNRRAQGPPLQQLESHVVLQLVCDENLESHVAAQLVCDETNRRGQAPPPQKERSRRHERLR